MEASSPYAVLGLSPGADRQAVERAYRKLMKLHHPDRPTGNAERAAEINRAYAELRRQAQEPEPRSKSDRLAEAIQMRRAATRRGPKRRRRHFPLRFALLGSALLVGLWQKDPIYALGLRTTQALTELWAPTAAAERTDRSAAPDFGDLSDSPVDELAVRSGIDSAKLLSQRQGEDALADWSRDCHRRLRQQPSLALLDRCAAFEIAVVALAGNDPLLDRGPFSTSAVTARQMSAAALFTDDHLAIQLRFDRIRSQVELALEQAPPTDPPADRSDD